MEVYKWEDGDWRLGILQSQGTSPPSAHGKMFSALTRNTLLALALSSASSVYAALTVEVSGRCIGNTPL